jgi:hypothetical protein
MIGAAQRSAGRLLTPYHGTAVELSDGSVVFTTAATARGLTGCEVTTRDGREWGCKIVDTAPDITLAEVGCGIH